MFNHEINPFPVSDKVTFRNVDKTITLTVRADGTGLVTGLKRVYDHLSNVTEETPDAERKEAARLFADTIFGEDQGKRLMTFYGGDSLAVITACGMYFRGRLGKKITKAQKVK